MEDNGDSVRLDTDVMVAILLKQSVAECSLACGTIAWRGRLCEYHQGFEDGMDAVLAAQNGGTTHA